MKHKIFISYSHKDKDKVDLIVKELENHPTFEPLVIAANREAGKLLADKVRNGIKNAEIIIPIITVRSISEQWINQEIGFATAIDRAVMPIIDIDLINDLKGFIHKQIDLPYSYQRKPIIGQENKNFLACFKTLLSDLEKSLGKNIPETEKTTFEKMLDTTDSVNQEIEFKQRRLQFLRQPENVMKANQEVHKMFNDVGDNSAKLIEKGLDFTKNQILQKSRFALLGYGYSFSIAWEKPNNSILKDNILIVRFWQGNVSLLDNVMYNGLGPKRLQDSNYSLDINKQNELCWRNPSTGKEFSSSQIIDTCMTWILNKANEERLKNPHLY